jgi:hypothetical protein
MSVDCLISPYTRPNDDGQPLITARLLLIEVDLVPTELALVFSACP